MTEIPKCKSTSKNYDTIINSNIYNILLELFRDIFFVKTTVISFERDNILEECIDRINKKLILKSDKYISKEYSIKNFKNIFSFVKTQNRIFAGEILEGILINVFSHFFEVDKDETFNKNIYNNLSKLRNNKDFKLIKWLKKEKCKVEEIGNLKQLLLKESLNEIYELQEISPLYNILYLINKEKYRHINTTNNYNNKTMFYINKGKINSFKIINNIYNSINYTGKNIFESDIILNSISKLSSFYFPKGVGRSMNNTNIGIIRAFLISVYVYYQIKHSPLMNYTKSPDKKENNEKLVNVPFTYDLSEGIIEGRFANIVISPIKIEKRISNIVLYKNNIREPGLLELSKALIFNKNIKSLFLNVSLIRSYYLDYILCGLRIFNNNSVEKLDLSFNYLNENCEESLAKIISHFKNLKSLNLSVNEIKRGMSSFFVVLKKLYRKKQTKLEILYLNKCLLDDSSYYELGELLKCKYCKLKHLFLNNNPIPLNINFLKKLKKNKSLTEINLSQNKISNKDIDDITKIISNSNIRHLYIYKNLINNFNEFLKIIYRTRVIKNEHDIDINIMKNNSLLQNLDLSNNKIFYKNSNHIKLLISIIKQTTLSCLDISHILYGINPEKMKKIKENEEYTKIVESLKTILEEEKKKNIKIIKEIKNKEIDLKRLEKTEKVENTKKFTHLNDKIFDIIKDEKSVYPLYLMEKANQLIKDENNKYNRDDSNIENKINKGDEQNLIKYMMMTKLKRDIKPLKKIRNDRKMVIL